MKRTYLLLLGSLSLNFRELLEVQQLHYLLHVTHFVGEKLNDSFVSADFAQMAHDEEERLDFGWHIKALSCHCLTDEYLQEAHDWRDESLQDWI